MKVSGEVKTGRTGNLFIDNDDLGRLIEDVLENGINLPVTLNWDITRPVGFLKKIGRVPGALLIEAEITDQEVIDAIRGKDTKLTVGFKVKEDTITGITQGNINNV